MARNLAVGNHIDLGNIVAAQFKRLDTWSVLAFFRVENTAGDDNNIISKWGGGANNSQFLLRVDKGAASQNIEVYTDGTLRINGGNNVALNTWYAAVVTNDGTGGASGLKLYLLDMSGTYLDDAVTGQHGSDDTDLTASIRIGERQGPNDKLEGDAAYYCYVDRELVKNDITAYLRDPIRTAKAWEAQSGLQFLMPLWGLHSPEIDLSAKGIVGTLTGTTMNNDPAVTISTPKWAAGTPLIEVAASGGFAHAQTVIIA